MAKKYDDDLEKELAEAHHESKERKEGSGSFASIFKDDIDVQRWKCKNGEHLIDIIPYRAGKFDPHRPEGKAAYFLDIYVHKGVGLTSDNYVCPSKNYKKRCPICEELKRLSDKDVPYEDFKDEVAKRVNVYNLVCYDNNEEEDKGVQVWDIANFFMEDKLRGLSKNKRTGEPIYYASPSKETGRSISFERKGKGKGKVEYLSHEFVKREEDIPKDILEQAVCLDEIIHIPTYEELYEAYYGKEYDKNEADSKLKRKRKYDDDEEDEKPSKRKRQDDDEDSGEEKTRKRPLRKKDDDEDEDEKPSKRHSRKKEEDDDDVKVDVELKCPAKNGVFGEDCDTLAKCKTCDIWDDCATEHDRLEAKSSSKKKQKRDDDDD